MTFRSAIYRGSVAHERMRPKRHRLRYAVYSLLLDLDELADLDRRLRFFAHNRFAPVSFHDADHGATTGEPLRPWVEDRLREAGLEPDAGPILLLCYPRIFGYVFNPLSVYFCYGRNGELKAILYEVCNTYAERHTYVIPVGDGGARVVRQACRKALYVSPFIAMETDYHFRVAPPDEAVSIAIRQEDAEGILLAACFRGQREDITDRKMVRLLFRFPMLTLKVIAAIHWEALRMWMKGYRVFPHRPADARVKSSTGRAGPVPLDRQGP